jgi:hypothetical protein
MRSNLSNIVLKIIPIMFIILISGLGLPTAFAYTQTFVGDDVFATGTTEIASGRHDTLQSPPQFRILKHSSGKIIILTCSVTLQRYFVNVYSSSGVELASVDISSAYTDNICGGPSIAEIDSNYILISLGVGGASAKVYFVKFHITTYTFTSKSTTFTTSGAAAINKLGQLIYDNGYFYVFVYDYGYSSGAGYGIARYSVAGDSASKLGETVLAHSNYMMPPYGYLDTANNDIYYMMVDTATDTINYLVFDIATGLFSTLCVNPSSGGFPLYNSFLYGYGNFINYYGGGIYTSGTYLYLYHCWSFSERTGAAYPAGSGVRYVETCFWYGKFNNSISSGTLLEQHYIMDYELDSSSNISASCGIGWGYIYNNPATPTFAIYTYYQDIYAGANIAKVTYTITDITSDPVVFTSSSIMQGMDNIDWKYISKDAQLGKDQIHGIAYHLQDNVNSYLVTGDPILGKVYTFSDSYAPADSPLLTNKNYVMTYNIYVNGVADDLNETAKIFVDGIERITKSIPSSGSNVGTITFNMLIGTAGIHSIILKIYNNVGDLDGISGEYSYTFITSTTPTGGVPSAPTLIGFYSDLFMIWLPIGIIVFLPLTACTMLGARYAGGAGAITGMMFGGAVGMIGGTVIGIIPTYALYLLVMLIATAIVVLFVRGSGGGSDAP